MSKTKVTLIHNPTQKVRQLTSEEFIKLLPSLDDSYSYDVGEVE